MGRRDSGSYQGASRLFQRACFFSKAFGIYELRITKHTLDKTPWSSNYIVQTVYANCEAFFKVSWLSTLILWSPGLPGSRGITCKSEGFGRKPVGSENACHFLWARKSLENMIFLKTWWKPAGLAPFIAPGNEVSDLQGLQQKNPQVYKSKFKPPPNLHNKKTRSPLILKKKQAPPQKTKTNAAKTSTEKHEENSKHENVQGPDPSIPRSNNQAPIQKCSKSRILWK